MAFLCLKSNQSSAWVLAGHPDPVKAAARLGAAANSVWPIEFFFFFSFFGGQGEQRVDLMIIALTTAMIILPLFLLTAESSGFVLASPY